MQKRFKKYFSLLLIFFMAITTAPIIVEANEDKEKTIHLTFDDGPGGKVTEEVLDILKQENVPATFFLIGSQIKGQEKLLIRMKDEGHSLGLHSMSHNKAKLYSSNESFLKEMLDTQALIKEVTGVNTNILRFPFGCNNNSYHLKHELVDLLHDNNLRIFDWNVDSTDGANPKADPSTFIKKSKSDKDNIVLLMHCGYLNKNSAKALPEIINYYKNQGYIFKSIEDDTQEEFHFIKN